MSPRPRRSSPLPYCGDDLDRWGKRGQPFERDKQGRDQSGTKHYRFNALGFRGPSFDPAAERHVCVFGESHAFGGGLDEQEAWIEHLVRSWSAAQGVPRERVCLSNFAEGGSSNGYISRAVVSQCERVRPDLIAVEFAGVSRAEAFLAGRPVRVGEWLSVTTRADFDALPDDALRALAKDLVARGDAYEAFSTPLLSAVDTLLNMHLVRAYCRARGVDVVASLDALRELREIVSAHEVARELWDGLDDGTFLMPECIRHYSAPDDKAADGSHPGVKTHASFGEAAWNFVRSRQPRARQPQSACATLWVGDRDDAAPPAAADDVDLRAPGRSNFRVARDLLVALARYRPERVAIRFGDFERAEGFDKNGDPFGIAAPAEAVPPSASRLGFFVSRDRARRARAYRAFVTEGRSALETVRWILLCQYAARVHGVPATASCPRWDRLDGPEARTIEALAPMLEQVDPEFLLDADPARSAVR